MNTINKITGIITAGITLICMATSCKKDNMPVKPISSAFTASMKNNTTFTAAGGKDTIVITAGTDGWWVTIPTGSSWCTVPKSYGAGDFKLPVTISANTTGAPRQVIITLNPTYDLPKVNITVNQSN